MFGGNKTSQLRLYGYRKVQVPTYTQEEEDSQGLGVPLEWTVQADLRATYLMARPP